MKFPTGISVLTYWYEYGDAVREYSIPAIFIHEDDIAKPPYLAPEHFDYPDWWYTWVDVDKIILKLTKTDWALILYYFRMVYKNEVGAFYRWKGKEQFKETCRRIYAMLSDDYKPKQIGRSKYKRFDSTSKDLHKRVERREINVDLIEESRVYTVKEVAEMLRYSVVTIRKMIYSGKLKAFQVGEHGDLRVTGKALLDLIKPVRGGMDEG